jgi:uncharacterized protein (UPF0332 family)
MNPRAFLDVAFEMLDGANEEHWRSAVSRAYYAAFHVARQLLVRCGFVVPQAQRAHAYLAMRLMNSGHPDLDEAGRGLDELRKARLRADYSMEVAVGHAWAQDQVSRALDVLRLLDEALAHAPTRERIMQAMRDYERDVLQDVTWQPPTGSPGAS